MEKRSTVVFKILFGVTLTLFTVSCIINASLLKSRKCFANNYAASMRILDKMTDKLTEYAIENRKLKQQITGRFITIASGSSE